MNDTPTNPILMMGLLFVLRCLLPLGILFGISYLLRRLELVIKNSDEALADMEEEDADIESITSKNTQAGSASKSPLGKKNKKGVEKKSATSKKKEHSQ